MIINIQINHQEMIIKNFENIISDFNSSVSYTKGYIECVFEFLTDDWDNTLKTAYFQNPATGAITSQILSNNRCLIPHEALTDEGYVKFSVAGEKEDYRITSSVVQFFNRPTVNGGEPSDPTQSQYEQIMAAAAAAQAAAESAEKTADYIKEQAESGAFNGEQGPQGEAGPQGPKGDTGPQGEKGDTGEAGLSATIQVGKTTTAEAGTPASVVNVGTESNAVFDFVIPKGNDGEKGLGIDDWLNPLDLSEYNSRTNALNVFSLDKGAYLCTESGYICNQSKKSPLQLVKGAYLIINTNSLCIVNGDGQYFISEDDEKFSSNTYLITKSDLQSGLANKKDKSIISVQDTSNITLSNNTEYRLQIAETINLTLPASIPDDYECSLVFESGESATVLSYTADSIKFVGDDCDSEGDFIPQANKGYEVSIKNLGYDRIIARVGAF